MARTRKNPVNPDKDFSRIISWVFLGVAALMTALALVSGISAGSAIASEESAPGRVVDFTIRKDSVGNEFYYPIVEFAAADAERQRVQTTEGSWPAAYLIGERVTVRYKPGQLQDVRIASAGSNFGPWIVTFITGLLAIAFTLATVFARWVSKQTLEEMPL